ncbi:MAG TPA: preprotein translocase subunit SecE [Candidatus Saccharimonadales bacterium]|nr:preprotein translocase subunit SecE [Candidatus Saccharimonadales bacterium]
MASESNPEKKRRLKPAAETVREQSARQRDVDATEKKSYKQAFFKFIGKATKPIWIVPFWIGRFIVPKYFKESFRELKNITWPTRHTSRQLTFAVIIFSVIFAFLVSVVDYGLGKVFKRVFLKG